MIIELFDLLIPWTPSSSGMTWQGVVCLGTLFFGPLFAAIWLRPTAARFALGLLAMALAYVVDFILSNAIVASQGLDMDRFPVSIELILYGIIASGWLFGSAIGGLVSVYGVRRKKSAT